MLSHGHLTLKLFKSKAWFLFLPTTPKSAFLSVYLISLNDAIDLPVPKPGSYSGLFLLCLTQLVSHQILLMLPSECPKNPPTAFFKMFASTQVLMPSFPGYSCVFLNSSKSFFKLYPKWLKVCSDSLCP